MGDVILQVDDLKTYFYTDAGIVKAIDDVSFKVYGKEILGLVGESGSGKTVTALSILRIIPKPGKILAGKVMYKNENLLRKSEKEMTKIRGKELAMSFQDPTTSLNPVYTIGYQLKEVIIHHQNVDEKTATKIAIELLQRVGIPEAERRMSNYPHEFSVGMKQRIALARAISCKPIILFADEPTTALDVTIQAQIALLLKKLMGDRDMSIVLITHDMGLVYHLANRVAIMYAGRVCEIADKETIFRSPKHPYSKALISSIPSLITSDKKLIGIPGRVPDLVSPPKGCRFHPRCKYATHECKIEIPPLQLISSGHLLACLRWDKTKIV